MVQQQQTEDEIEKRERFGSIFRATHKRRTQTKNSKQLENTNIARVAYFSQLVVVAVANAEATSHEDRDNNPMVKS